MEILRRRRPNPDLSKYVPIYDELRQRIGEYLPQEKILTKSMATKSKTRKSSKKGKRKFYKQKPARALAPYSVARKLKTCLNGSINAGAGTMGSGVIALNACNDPFLTLDTSQPLGFDQYTALYNRYCVVGWSIKMDIVTTDNTNPTVVGFCPHTSSTVLSNYIHYREAPGNKTRIMTPDIDKAWLRTRGSVEKYLLGGKKKGKILSNDNLTADLSANPVRPLYGHIYAQAMDGSADPANVLYNLVLEQIVIFYDPKIPARS